MSRSRPGSSAGREGGDQLDRRLDVGQVDHLDRGVHVAQRDRDQAGGDAGARDLDRVGVGVGRAARRPRSCTGCRSARRSRRAARRSAATASSRGRSPGPEPSWWRPCSFSSTPGASVAWVTSTAIARSGWSENDVVSAPLEPISSWTAATAAIRPFEAAALVHSAQRLERHVDAEPVVERAGDQPAPFERQRVGGDHGRSRRCARARARRRSSAAPMSMCMSRSSTTFLRCSSLSRWIGLRPITPGTGAVLGLDSHALAEQDLRVPAADRREVQEALLVDVGDHQADLVDVPDDREKRACVRRRRSGPPRSRARRVVTVGERGGVSPDVARGALVAGGPGAPRRSRRSFGASVTS